MGQEPPQDHAVEPFCGSNDNIASKPERIRKLLHRLEADLGQFRALGQDMQDVAERFERAARELAEVRNGG